jgi:hypothetical protein
VTGLVAYCLRVREMECGREREIKRLGQNSSGVPFRSTQRFGPEFYTFPTAASTFQAVPPLGGYGLSKSTGGLCRIHRSKPTVGYRPLCAESAVRQGWKSINATELGGYARHRFAFL